PVFIAGTGNYELRGTGRTQTIQVDTVLSLIGFQVDADGWDLETVNGRLRVRADDGVHTSPIDRYSLDHTGALPMYGFGWALGSQGSDGDIEYSSWRFAQEVTRDLQNRGAAPYHPEQLLGLRQR